MAYIPSIAVEIEPKLLAVHQMMPLSTQLLNRDRFNDLNKKIQLCLNYDDSFIKSVDKDLSNNSLLAKKSIEKLHNWCKDVKNKKIIILFSGYSVNNTPKLENLINSLQNEGYSLSLFGIVKDRSNNLKNVNTTYLYSKGNTQGLIKIFCVFYYIIKLCIYLIFKI